MSQIKYVPLVWVTFFWDNGWITGLWEWGICNKSNGVASCNQSPNQLIIEFRQNEAKRMLEDKAGTVSEVVYSMGDSNMSYFIKSFKEQFGVLPSKV